MLHHIVKTFAVPEPPAEQAKGPEYGGHVEYKVPSDSRELGILERNSVGDVLLAGVYLIILFLGVRFSIQGIVCVVNVVKMVVRVGEWVVVDVC